VEGDELVYQTLAKNLVTTHIYSLQNTELLQFLSSDIYNTPIFFRPPVFATYLAILYTFLGVLGFRIASVIVYILLCVIIYKIVWHLTKSQNSALKALVLSTLSPLLLVSSVQIRLDLFMTLMASLGFYFAILFRESKQVKHSFLSGLFLALALLTNYTSIIVYPFIFLFMISKSKPRQLILSSLYFFLPTLLIGLWFYIYFVQFHMSLASLFSAPSKEMLEKFKFLSYVHDRPFYFYLVTIFITNPLNLFLMLLFKKSIRETIRAKSGKLLYLLLFIFCMILLFLTLYGIQGGTYQMRYMLLAEPILIILLALIPFEKNYTLWCFFWFIALYNIFLVLYNIGYGNAELFTFKEIYERMHPS
jgi:4-amino-4-deoxy-L-arabinose transferase-like glycosyltransferase